MSLLVIEGFDHYEGNTQLNFKGWLPAVTSSVDISVELTIGRDGGGGVRMEGTTGTGSSTYMTRYISRPVPKRASMVMGFRFKTDGFNDNLRVICAFLRESRVHLVVRITSAGRLQVAYSSASISNSTPSNETLIAESVQSLSSNTFHFIEFKATPHASSGSFELRVDGVTWLQESGVKTNNDNALDTDIDGLLLNSPAPSSTEDAVFDDVYVLDLLGTENNDFLGDIKVTTVMPNADGAHTDLTPLSGTDHFAMVDEVPIDEDTTYLHSDVIGHKDSFGFPDLSGDIGTIFGVQASAIARKEEAGHRAARVLTRISGVDYVGDEKGVTFNYSLVQHLWDQDPDAVAAWTEAAVNGAEFGVEIR